MKESVDMSALFEEWLTISRPHLFCILAHISFRVSLISRLQNPNFDANEEQTRTDILMNKLLLPASVQMLQASITLAHPLKRTLPNNKLGTNSSQIHWPWPINPAFCQNKIYFVPDLC